MSLKKASNIYTIYALVNPFTKEPFYVGATKVKIKNRLLGHLSEARSTPIYAYKPKSWLAKDMVLLII